MLEDDGGMAASSNMLPPPPKPKPEREKKEKTWRQQGSTVPKLDNAMLSTVCWAMQCMNTTA